MGRWRPPQRVEPATSDVTAAGPYQALKGIRQVLERFSFVFVRYKLEIKKKKHLLCVPQKTPQNGERQNNKNKI